MRSCKRSGLADPTEEQQKETEWTTQGHQHEPYNCTAHCPPPSTSLMCLPRPAPASLVQGCLPLLQDLLVLGARLAAAPDAAPRAGHHLHKVVLLAALLHTLEQLLGVACKGGGGRAGRGGVGVGVGVGEAGKGVLAAG